MRFEQRLQLVDLRRNAGRQQPPRNTTKSDEQEVAAHSAAAVSRLDSSRGGSQSRVDSLSLSPRQARLESVVPGRARKAPKARTKLLSNRRCSRTILDRCKARPVIKSNQSLALGSPQSRRLALVHRTWHRDSGLCRRARSYTRIAAAAESVGSARGLPATGCSGSSSARPSQL